MWRLNKHVPAVLREPERQHLRASGTGAPAYASISTRCTTAATAVVSSCAGQEQVKSLQGASPERVIPPAQQPDRK